MMFLCVVDPGWERRRHHHQRRSHHPEPDAGPAPCCENGETRQFQFPNRSLRNERERLRCYDLRVF